MRPSSRIIRVLGSRILHWLVLLVVSLGETALMAAEIGTTALPPETKPLAAVYDMQRPDKTDLLVLWNGEQMAGTILNEAFNLSTSYAPLKLERRMLAGIDLNHSIQGTAAVITVNRNRISGYLDDPFFKMKLRAGGQTEVRREKVRQVVFGLREDELRGISHGQKIRLRNGDWLSGQLPANPVSIASSQGRSPVNLREATSLVFTTNRPSLVLISLANGQMIQGNLEIEDLPILLDVGPKINLYIDYIETIGENANADANHSTTNQPSARATISAAAPSPSNTTNRAGMVWIVAGDFNMGSPTDEAGRDPDEGPQTQVTILQGFWMGKCEVTQAEYKAVMGTNPSNTLGDGARPVERVNWYEAMEYCAKLNQREEAAGQLPAGWSYRLPTEAEWEYACRAGTSTRFSFGDDKSDVLFVDYAWFTRNSESMTHPVGAKRPNPWGLHDMHGNVWEWCLDRWEGSLPGGATTNLPAAAKGTLRVARGGSWLYDGRACRSANRDDYSPSNRCGDVGFRVVLAPGG